MEFLPHQWANIAPLESKTVMSVRCGVATCWHYWMFLGEAMLYKATAMGPENDVCQ